MASERRSYRKSGHEWQGSSVAADDGADPVATPPQADVDTLEAALQRSRFRLRFVPSLERAYERDTRVRRNLRIGVCTMLGSVGFLANTTRDLAEMPDLAPVLWPISFWGTVFVALAFSLILWRRHSTPGWLVEIVSAFGTLLTIAYIASAAHWLSDSISLVIRTGGLFLLFLHTGLVARQQFRYCLVSGLLGLLAYTFAARARDAQQALVVMGHIRLLVTTLAFTLIANHVLERRERRAFLLRALDQHRRRALTEDAAVLQRLSLSDPLTGVANRRRFDNALQTAWVTAAERAEPLAVLQVDVDFFKRYNDLYGHPAGDACLKRVAGALHRLARQHNGLAARTGGEEFALLLPRCSLEAAARIGETVCAAVRALALSHADSAAAPCVTVSIGAAAVVPAGPQGAHELLIAGDVALYDAKRCGRDRVACAPAAAAPASTAAPPPPSPPPSSADATPATSRTAALEERIETLSAALHRGLHWLRFPPAIEAAYMAARARRRGIWLAALALGGMVYTCGYVWSSRPLFADVADSVVDGMLMLTVAFLPLAIIGLRPIAPRLRETLLSVSVVAVCTVEVSLLAQSRLITVYGYSLALFLVPMFSTVLAAQPFRFSLVTSLCAWGVMLVGLKPATPDWRVVWLDSSLLLLSGTLFSLIGGYLIDLSARRDYLLHRIADARNALLTDNAATLRLLAESDPLTGLANRRKFDAEHAALLHACVAAGEPLALLIVDIDHFKRYNDRYGHLQGDACLRRVAEALRQAQGDGPASTAGERLVARLGGEEFGLLVPGCDATRALQLAEALCARVRRLAIPHSDSPVAANVTVSIGVASTGPAGRDEPATLLHAADAALYRAKDRGRDQVGA